MNEVPWIMRPLYDTVLSQYVPERCVPAPTTAVAKTVGEHLRCALRKGESF
jgi:hypothetical protein